MLNSEVGLGLFITKVKGGVDARIFFGFLSALFYVVG